MQMTLDRFIKVMNTKFNLKIAAERLGFENINNVLFIRESDGAYIKFDDEEIDIWFSSRTRRRTSQYYNAIRTEIDNGHYTEESYIQWALENLKY